MRFMVIAPSLLPACPHLDSNTYQPPIPKTNVSAPLEGLEICSGSATATFDERGTIIALSFANLVPFSSPLYEVWEFHSSVVDFFGFTPGIPLAADSPTRDPRDPGKTRQPSSQTDVIFTSPFAVGSSIANQNRVYRAFLLLQPHPIQRAFRTPTNILTKQDQTRN